jgi:hypothetical protein
MSNGYVDADGHEMEKAEKLIQYLEETLDCPREMPEPLVDRLRIWRNIHPPLMLLF